MLLSFKDLEKASLQLSVQERALLAKLLLDTLDEDDNVDIEELWLTEAERRYQAYRAGKMSAKPAEKVFQEAYSKLK